MPFASTASLRAALLSAAVLSTLHGTPAQAQSNSPAAASEESKAKARSLATQAFQALDRSDYASAVIGFNLAIQSYDAPTLRVGRGTAFEGLGKLSEAAEDYRAAANSVFVTGEPSSFAAARAQAREKLKAVEARLQATSPAAEPAPASSPDSTNAPAQEPASAAVEGSPELQPTPWAPSNTPGAPASIAVASSPSPVPAAEQPNPGAAIALGTVTVALGLGAFVTGILFLGAKSEFDNANGYDRSEAESKRSTAKTLAWANTALLLGTVTTGILTIVVWPESSPSTAAAKQPFDLAGLQLGVKGAF